MALVLELSTRNASVNAVVDLIDAAATPGKLKILADGGAELCTIQLATPAFSPAADGKAIANKLPLQGTGTPAAGAGTKPTHYQVTDGNDNVIWRGAIPGNLKLDSATIAEGQLVHMTSWGHMQPAGDEKQ